MFEKEVDNSGVFGDHASYHVCPQDHIENDLLAQTSLKASAQHAIATLDLQRTPGRWHGMPTAGAECSL